MSDMKNAGQDHTGTSDSVLLEGLYQLAVTGHTQDWEFERLNKAVYERLISSYQTEGTAPTYSARLLVD